MSRALFVMRELSLSDFQNAIFQSNGDVLAPVVIESDRRPFQSLAYAIGEPAKHPSRWMSVVGPVGIGQFSLDRKIPAAIFARWDTHARIANPGEIEADINEYGEQVLGPEVTEVSIEELPKYINCPKVKVLGAEYYFTGPPRLVKSVFTSRVIPTVNPDTVKPLEIIAEIDDAAEKGEFILHQNYCAVFARDGRLKQLTFKHENNYMVSGLKELGNVRWERGRLMFYQEKNGKAEIDFTQNAYRPN